MMEFLEKKLPLQLLRANHSTSSVLFKLPGAPFTIVNRNARLTFGEKRKYNVVYVSRRRAISDYILERH